MEIKRNTPHRQQRQYGVFPERSIYEKLKMRGISEILCLRIRGRSFGVFGYGAGFHGGMLAGIIADL